MKFFPLIIVLFITGCAGTPASPQNSAERSVLDESPSTVSSVSASQDDADGSIDVSTSSSDGDSTSTDNDANREGEATPEMAANERNESTAALPYSVAALQQLPLSGGNLSLEAVETVTDTYTRWRIFYTSNGYRISGILNIPSGEGPYPLLILNHGYIDPAVYTVGRGLRREQDYLARQGFAVLHTDYRIHGLSDDDPRLQENYVFRNYFYAQDAINAILSVQESELEEVAPIDSSRVGMLGHSMGGGVTMHALVTRPDLIDAAVLYAPVHSSEWYNFNRRRANDLTDAEKKEYEERLGELSVEGFMPYSVTPVAGEIDAPVQIYFGTNDQSVPYERGVEIQSIFSAAGVDSELITYQGEAHEFIGQFAAFMQGTTSFFHAELEK